MDDSSRSTNDDQFQTTGKLTPKQAYDEFANAFIKYMRWVIIGILVLVGVSAGAAANLFSVDSIVHHLFRDVGIAILVAAIIAVVYETYARMRFELMLMTSFLGAVIADWSRQDVWNALKSQIIEKPVIRENLRLGVRLLHDKRLAPGQMLLKLSVGYDLLGLRSEPMNTTVEHFLDWHFKIKGEDLPRFNCVEIAGQDIPTNSKYFNDNGEFLYPLRVPAKDRGSIAVTSVREEVIYVPGTHCFVLNEITKGIEIFLAEIPDNMALFVTVRPHRDLKYKELKTDGVRQHIKSSDIVLFPGQIIELLFQPKEETSSLSRHSGAVAHG